MKKAVLAVVFLTLGLIGCGGGGSSDGDGPAPSKSTVSAAGFWEGNIIDGDGFTYEVSGVITPDGELRFFSWPEESQFAGTFTMDGNNASGNITGYAPPGFVFENNSPVASGTISFTVTEKSSIAGSYSLPGDNGNFNLNYSALGEENISQSYLEGYWGHNFPGDMVDFHVDGAGNLSGTDDVGCQYGGTIKVIEPGWNMFRVNLNVSQCGGNNGTYSGLSLIEHVPTYGDVLWTMVSNSQTSVLDVFDYSTTPWSSAQ